jgi:large subunit ribosomal protein L9
MNENLILLEDINGLGKAGDAVSVTTGYARNYLLPKKLALKASKGAIRQFEALKEKIEAKRLAEIEEMQALATKIAKLEITISMNIGEDDKLYGSVTSHTIASEIKKLGVEIDHHKLVLENPIKELGAFDVDIKLHPEVVAKARVWVVKA